MINLYIFVVYLLFIINNINKIYCNIGKQDIASIDKDLKKIINFDIKMENDKKKNKNVKTNNKKKKHIKKRIKKQRKIKINGKINIKNNIMDSIIDITEYKININKLKNVIDEVNKVNEEDRVFIQSDTEGKVFNIISTLQIANIIDINNPIEVYYNFENGKFENIKSKNSIKLKLFKVNKGFSGIYIHLGDIVDRCTGNHQCLKSLLLLLYIKQELGDKIKLICGNHELTDYFRLGNPGCNCCYDVRDIITLIVFKAISNGQIKYLDQINIGYTDYILTHKVLYTLDIDKIKCFLKDKINNVNDLNEYNFSKLIDVVNNSFKGYFTNIFNVNKEIDIYNYSSVYDHLYNEIVVGERVKILGYNICLKNQICGHDHHEINKCYIEDKNILFVDNYSYDINSGYNEKPMSNIHFFNKREEVNKHKIFNIINCNDSLKIKIIQ